MSAEAWPCSCGNPGVRNVAARGYCAHHLAELYSTFDPAVFAECGLGLQTGRMRPEYGPSESELMCARCGAGWIGVPGAACWWCQRLAAMMREWHAEKLLRPPEVERDDVNYDACVEAWAERLARGVLAGIVDERAARRVLSRIAA